MLICLKFLKASACKREVGRNLVLKLIGVLALQGDYDKHLRTLDRVNIPAIDVRYPSQLSKIDGLIIPGGESTTMNDLMSRIDFHNHLIDFAQKKPIMGTCAGLILKLTPHRCPLLVFSVQNQLGDCENQSYS